LLFIFASKLTFIALELATEHGPDLFFQFNSNDKSQKNTKKAAN